MCALTLYNRILENAVRFLYNSLIKILYVQLSAYIVLSKLLSLIWCLTCLWYVQHEALRGPREKIWNYQTSWKSMFSVSCQRRAWLPLCASWPVVRSTNTPYDGRVWLFVHLYQNIERILTKFSIEASLKIFLEFHYGPRWLHVLTAWRKNRA